MIRIVNITCGNWRACVAFDMYVSVSSKLSVSELLNVYETESHLTALLSVNKYIVSENWTPTINAT